MKKFTKFSIGMAVLAIIGIVVFIGCQKELDKIDANKPNGAKSSTIQSFGDAVAGEYHNAHLDKVTTLASFPEYGFDEQYELAIASLPGEYGGAAVVSPDMAYQDIAPIVEHPENALEYVKEVCLETGTSEQAINYISDLTNIMNNQYAEGLEAQNLEVYVSALKELKSNVEYSSLNPSEKEMLVGAITIAYYSGHYWSEVISNPKDAWYPVIDKSKCNWWCKIKKAIRVAAADAAGFIRGYKRCGYPCAILEAALASVEAARK